MWGGSLLFVGEFLQAFVRRTKEKFYLLVEGFRIANLVCFHRREVVLLLRSCGTQNRRGRLQKANQKQEFHFQFHGCFSAGGVASGFSGGGAASCFSTGRRGKSILSSSSSISMRSWRTICNGGLWPSGDT